MILRFVEALCLFVADEVRGYQVHREHERQLREHPRGALALRLAERYPIATDDALRLVDAADPRGVIDDAIVERIVADRVARNLARGMDVTR